MDDCMGICRISQIIFHTVKLLKRLKKKFRTVLGLLWVRVRVRFAYLAAGKIQWAFVFIIGIWSQIRLVKTGRIWSLCRSLYLL